MKNKLWRLTSILFGLCFMLLSFSKPKQDVGKEELNKDVYGIKTVSESKLTESKIKEYKAKKEYDYFKQNKESPQKVEKQQQQRNNVGDFIDDYGKYIKYTFILLFVLVVIAVALSILKNNKGVFNRNKIIASSEADISEIDEETIEENDFESMLSKAKNKEDYRLVLRLLFLQSLQILNDKKHIKYKKNKTNYEYSFEIKNGAIQVEFNKTADLFAWVWYGNTEIEKDSFEKIEPTFVKLIRILEK